MTKKSRSTAAPRSGTRSSRTSVRASAGAAAETRQGVVSRLVFIQATQTLGTVLSFEFPADAVLSRQFREHRELGARDRAFIAEAVYGVLRRLRWLRRLVGERASARELLLAWCARGLGWPMRSFEGLISATERDWLESVKAAELDEGTLAERADLPDWLVERLLRSFSEEGVLELAHGLNRPAPLDLRANLLRTDRDRLLASLQADGIAAEAGQLSPQAIRLAGKPALHRHPRFLDGSFEVQDEGSQLLGLLVQPRRGEMVVDFCAGAGGKTLQLGAMMRSTGRLYAFDVSEKRLAKLKPRMARAGLSNVHPVRIEHESDARVKRLAGKADRVLVDAPCTGLGTVRRNPDLKWRQSPAAVKEMAAKQAAILASAARLVRPGGRLVYATCSLLVDENDDIVDGFLAAHPQFSVVSAQAVLEAQGVTLDCGERLRLLPHRHDTDGFFAVVMERADGA